MINIKSLSGVSFEEIAMVFNESFSDYYFPIRFTAEQFAEKFASEKGVLELSVGAYDGEKIVGFILHFLNEIEGVTVVYNGGTGVVPSCRGQGITLRMYDYILPILKSKQIDRMVHEVLSLNTPAINIYKKVGFNQVRLLDCFKGRLSVHDKKSQFELREIESYDWKLMTSFWDYAPTWQNSILTLNNLKSTTLSFGVFVNSNLAGYIIFNPHKNRIHQLAVHSKYRRQGIGTHLLNKVAERAKDKDVTVINVDRRLESMRKLFEKLGLESFIEQIELERF